MFYNVPFIILLAASLEMHFISEHTTLSRHPSITQNVTVRSGSWKEKAKHLFTEFKKEKKKKKVHCQEFPGSSACYEDLALALLWFRLLVWCRFSPGPRNFLSPQGRPKKKNFEFKIIKNKNHPLSLEIMLPTLFP